MKIKPEKKFIKNALNRGPLWVALIFLCACKPGSERLHDEAYAEIEKGHYRVAADLLEKSAEAERSESTKFKTLLEAARITRFEIQDYERSIRTYKKIILQSPDENQRIDAQRAITEIYLENIQNYSQALRELQILEPLVKNEKDKEKIRLKIAQAQYLTGNYQSALEEIETTFKNSITETMNLLKLKAQVFAAQKKYKEAIATYQIIFKKNPQYFESENLFIAASVVYEENEEYSAALDYLVKYENQIKDRAYYELRLKRLKERLINKPFYKGRRK